MYLAIKIVGPIKNNCNDVLLFEDWTHSAGEYLLAFSGIIIINTYIPVMF